MTLAHRRRRPRRTAPLPGLLSRPLLGLALLAAPAAAQEGGIEVFAGETLFDTGVRLSVSYLHTERSGLRAGTGSAFDPLGRSSVEDRTVFGVDYGLTPDLTVSALVPYVSRELDGNTGSRSADGLGDVALLAKYRFYQRNAPQESLNLAVIGGLELPTGADDERDGAGLLPASVQPGAGAWNPFAALSLTYGKGRGRLDSTLFFKLNTEGAGDLDRGDFLTFDVSGAYRFYHAKYPGPTVGARLGLQYRHEGSSELAGARVVDSGAELVLAKASVGAHPTPDTDLSLGYETPLWEDYDGEQLGRDGRLVFKLGLRF